MAGDTERMLGSLEGKLDQLIRSTENWHREHGERHKLIDESIAEHAADINKAKGAKAAIMITASALAGLVSVAIAAAERIFK